MPTRRLRTIGLISVLAFGLLAGPLHTEAQQAGKIHQIGFLSNRSGSPTTDPRLIAFRQGLTLAQPHIGAPSFLR